MAQTPPSAPHKTSAAENKMKTVKAAWDKALLAPKKDAAQNHQAAEKAHKTKKDADCIKDLNAATHALA